MYLLNRLILIDSYKPGELAEVRLDGHTNLNGVNGAGKTTLLRLDSVGAGCLSCLQTPVNDMAINSPTPSQYD